MNSIASWAITLLIAILPVVTLTIGGGSDLFYVLLALCVAVPFARHDGWRSWCAALRPHLPMLLALQVPIAAVLISQATHATWHGASIEKAARISIAMPILLGALLQLDAKVLRHALSGILVAGWAGALYIFWLIYPKFNRPPTEQYNAVGYGNLMLLLAALTVYSLYVPLTRHAAIEKAVKALTAMVIFAAFILTQTRTGWLAIPVFALIMLGLTGGLRRRRRAIPILLGALAVLVALGWTNPALKARVTQGIHEVQACHDANATEDTSVCIRFQLWRATVQMIQAHPLTGLGSNVPFSDELRARVATGVVSPFVAENFGEPHNDMLYALSSFGILGGIGLLLTYVAPALHFCRRLRDGASQTARASAAMGLALCLGFAVFGLTEFMFRGMRTVSLYVVFLSLFIALASRLSSSEKSRLA